MSDQNVTLLLQIVSIVCSAATTIAIAVVGMWMKGVNRETVADRNVVKRDLRVTKQEVTGRLEVIHGLVNSGLGIVLEEAAMTAAEGAVAAERLAEAQPSPEHEALWAKARQKAEVARRASEYHKVKQRLVDERQDHLQKEDEE